MTVPFLFFDCWYTLFTADLGEDLVRITDLLGVPYTKSFIKTFEAALMERPELDLRPGVRRLMTALGRSAGSSQMNTIVEILEAGFDRQRPYDDTLVALESLRRQYRIGLITNSSQGAFEELSRTYELPARFDVIVPSYEVGAIKPDKHIYEAALARAGVAADAAVMIGDSPGDDYQGSLSAGFAGAVLLDRRGRHHDHPHRILELAQLDNELKSLII
jgi:HAD superfamily hydrolase (TIGR01549 family)